MSEQVEMQLKPHQIALMDATQPYVGLFGGVGNGKTTTACLKILEHTVNIPDNLCLIGRLTYPELRDSTREVFLSLLRQCYPPSAYQFNRSENSITFWNKSVVIFRHLDDKDSLLGPNLGAFYVDQAEEVDEDVFHTLQSRLRRNGVKYHQGIITGNPKGHNWVYYKFGMDKADDAKDWVWNTDYRMITAPTQANAENLPPTMIEQLMRSYSQEWFARYVMGSWDVFEDQIFDITKVMPLPETMPQIRMAFTAVDPAISKNKKACNTCFTTLGVATDGHIYDLETVASKWSFEETLQQAERIIDLHKPMYLGVEDVGYQRALYEACARYFEKTGTKIIDLKADKDKFRRAKSVSHIVAKGLFHSSNKELLAEMSAFVPDAPADQRKDRVDALVHCLHMVQRYAPTRFERPKYDEAYMKKPSHERFFWRAHKSEIAADLAAARGERLPDSQDFGGADSPQDPDFY